MTNAERADKAITSCVREIRDRFLGCEKASQLTIDEVWKIIRELYNEAYKHGAGVPAKHRGYTEEGP